MPHYITGQSSSPSAVDEERYTTNNFHLFQNVPLCRLAIFRYQCPTCQFHKLHFTISNNGKCVSLMRIQRYVDYCVSL
ncbi:MAG: hypothetical protein ACRDB3_13900 [Citrobacter telavivensis]